MNPEVVYRTGNWIFSETDEAINFEQGLKGVVGWEEFEEVEEIAMLLGLEARGRA
jgi:hypothetical protein